MFKSVAADRTVPCGPDRDISQVGRVAREVPGGVSVTLGSPHRTRLTRGTCKTSVMHRGRPRGSCPDVRCQLHPESRRLSWRLGGLDSRDPDNLAVTLVGALQRRPAACLSCYG